MYHERRPSTASSISSTHSNNPIAKTMRSARDRLSRRGVNKATMNGNSACSSRSPTPPGQLMDNGRKSSTCSERSCSHIPADDMTQVWRCMLELQGEYGCYNSTRMEVAAEAGDDALDLMRESYSSWLP